MSPTRILSTLLLAMGFQGLTPDSRDLGSAWLLNLFATAAEASPTPDFGPPPISMPGPVDAEDGAPGKLCSKIDLESAVRLRDKGGCPRPVAVLGHTAIGPGERRACRPMRSISAVGRRTGVVNILLCRFLC